MKILLIIPVFNEEQNIEKCINSILKQTIKVEQITIVNDNSNDLTESIIQKSIESNDSINYIKKDDSDQIPKPGKKIIEAFKYGLLNSIKDYDLIGKFDGDLILPSDYFEKLVIEFNNNPNLGLASGVIAINKEKKWKVENMYDKNHVRGGIKLYRKKAFDKIDGLIDSIGWDTLDEMKLLYYNYEIKVKHEIICKQMRETGKRYSNFKYFNQGRVMYLLGYDIFLCLIGSIKFSLKEMSINPFLISFYSYLKSWYRNDRKIVNNKLSKFVRSYRYNNILKKIK